MKAACAGKLDSLPELLSGKFPKALEEVFTAQGRGLFPSPQEIDFDCSCPDWADMCKHVAATLYGIGTRLDDDAGLFFKLRKVKIDDLIQQTLKDQSYQLLEKAEKYSTMTDIHGLKWTAVRQMIWKIFGGYPTNRFLPWDQKAQFFIITGRPGLRCR